MDSHDPDQARCIDDLTHLFAGLEIWLRTTVDPVGQDRDTMLSTILAELMLHADLLSGQGTGSTVPVFTAEAHLLDVLDWFTIAPNDAHQLLHLARVCLLRAHDPHVVGTMAQRTWESLRSGTTGSTEPISPQGRI